MERTIRYLSRVQKREGDRILRSVPQMAKGLELPVEGLSVRQIRDRYENQITNTLTHLQAAGYVHRVERDLRRPNGEGIGIVVVLRAGVAQSVRASRFAAPARTDVRSTRRPSCSSSTRLIAPPRGGTIGGPGDSKSLERSKPIEAGRARALGTRAAALVSSDVSAALRQIACERGLEELTGVRILERYPGLELVPVEIVAREAWRLFRRPGSQGDCRLSLSGRETIARASSQLERVGYSVLGPGAGASRAAALDLALGDWIEHWQSSTDRNPLTGRRRAPRTLGGLALCLRRLAHQHVTQRRSRRRAARG